jgi:hypothetical protein
MDKELAEIRADMEKLEMKMRQDKKSRWVYEWPIKKSKVKWPVRELMVIRQRRLLKGWLRYAENLKATEEEMVQVCEPEIGEILGEEIEMGSADDLKNCREGREEIPDFQEGNELRSLRDLTDCQEDSQGISICQVGNEERSLRDLKDCQEGSGRFPDCQVGKGTELRSTGDLTDYQKDSQEILHCQLGNERRLLRDLEDCQEGSGSILNCQVGRDEQMRLSEGLINSEMKLDQQVQLKAVEDQRNLLMIGGIEVFLPFSQEEAEQSTVTVREEELEQTLEAAQEREENEHSEERLNDFSQGAEREEVAALKLTAEEAGAEEEDKHYEEWLDIFSQEDEETATWEFAAEEEEEDTDNICFADLCQQIEALEERVKVQSMHIQQVKLEDEEEGMGDHGDLPMCQKKLQLRRLHEQNQPGEQLDKVIEEIMELMIRSVETASEERLGRKEATTTAAEWSRWKAPKVYLGSRRIPIA